MTLAVSNYGRMERPLEKKPVTPNASPLEIVRTAYQQWLPVALPHVDKRHSVLHAEDLTALYEEAEHILRPNHQALGKLSQSDLERMCSETTNWGKGEVPALFEAAVFNQSAVAEMKHACFHDYIGYQLEAGKSLLVPAGPAYPNNADHVVGRRMQGRMANFTDAANFALLAKDAVSINFAKLLDLASWSTGIHANFGDTEYFGLDGSGIYINYGIATHFGPGSGIFINFGRVLYYDSLKPGGMAINFGSWKGFHGITDLFRRRKAKIRSAVWETRELKLPEFSEVKRELNALKSLERYCIPFYHPKPPFLRHDDTMLFNHDNPKEHARLAEPAFKLAMEFDWPGLKNGLEAIRAELAGEKA